MTFVEIHHHDIETLSNNVWLFSYLRIKKLMHTMIINEGEVKQRHTKVVGKQGKCTGKNKARRDDGGESNRRQQNGFGEESRGKLNLIPIKVIYIFVPHEQERETVWCIYIIIK